MIVDNGRHYLYRHMRPDKDQPFYIGIGTKGRGSDYNYQGHKSEYKRAYRIQDKGKIWKDIFVKNGGMYEIEILLESNDYKFIKQKEIEFIRLYGRINLGTGILANLTIVNCCNERRSKSAYGYFWRYKNIEL